MDELSRAGRLAEADERMSRHVAEMARHWWGMGQVAREVDREELYKEGGFPDVFAWAFLRHRVGEVTVRKAIDVAAHFSAEMAEAHGSEKLASTLDYLQATRKVEQIGEATALTFRVKRQGRFASIPFSSATYRDIDEAKRLVESANAPKPPVFTPALVARAEALAAALPGLPRGAGGKRVEIRRDADGRERLTFRSVDPEGLEAFARAILDAIAVST